MSDAIILSIITPERCLLKEVQARIVTLNGSEGQIQILPGHAPMIGTLEAGLFSYEAISGDPTGVISSGFFEVRDDVVTVMAETLELSGEIDVSRAKAAQERAEKTLRDSAFDEAVFRKFQLKLQRSLVRQQAASKK